MARRQWSVALVVGLLVVVMAVTGDGPGFGVAVGAVSAAVLFRRLHDARWARGEFGTWMILTAGGLYACVPETDLVIRVVAVAAVVTIVDLFGLLEPVQLQVVDGTLVALTGIVAIGGGAFRPSAMVGAVGCLALLLAPMAGDRLPSLAVARRLPDGVTRLASVGVHAVSCLAMARFAGIGPGLAKRVLIAIFVFIVASAAHGALRRPLQGATA